MKNGIYYLFGTNIKAKKDFYDWCKENEDLSIWDLDALGIELTLGALDNTLKYIYLNKGNILDYLESKGYYIGIPIRSKFKFVTCCYYMNGEFAGRPFYNNSGVKDRVRALELGIEKCINELEKQL